MCKHVAATLYGVGARLDSRPELLFVLRGVDHMQLIDEAVWSGGLTNAAAAGPAGIKESELAEVFGVEIETPASAPRKAEGMRKPRKMARRPSGKPEGKGKRGKGTNQPAGRIARGAKEKAKARGKKQELIVNEHDSASGESLISESARISPRTDYS
jgi:uncharacterized Zn finger protein